MRAITWMVLAVGLPALGAARRAKPQIPERRSAKWSPHSKTKYGLWERDGSLGPRRRAARPCERMWLEFSNSPARSM